jgi:hypothetical protein
VLETELARAPELVLALVPEPELERVPELARAPELVLALVPEPVWHSR